MTPLLCIKSFLISVGVCILACSLTGCVESTFILANDSKLPQSITIPPGLTRKDISVTLNLYTPLQGADAAFVLKDVKGNSIEEVKGKTRNLPQSTDLQIVTERGKTETLRLKPYKEHQNMEQNGRAVALFYVIDD